MSLSNKLTGLLLAAIVMVLSMATSESAKAVPYTVCNNSGAPVVVTVFMNCGGGRVALAPVNVIITPGTCFTWNVPAGCMVVGVRVNGVGYPTPPAFPFCYPVAAPPPNFVCFTGGAPQVNIM